MNWQNTNDTPSQNKMETPAYKTTQSHVRLGRRIPKTLRDTRKNQWVDINQIVGGPEIYEFLGDIAR